MTVTIKTKKSIILPVFFTVFVVSIVGGSTLYEQNTDRINAVLFAKFDIAVSPEFIKSDARLASRLGEYYLDMDGRGGEYDIDKARTYFIRAREITPDISGPLFYLGLINFIFSGFDSALHKFEKQLALYPSPSDPYYLRTKYMQALTYGFIKDFDKSEEGFLELLNYNRENPNSNKWAVYTDLSWVYFQQGRYEEIVELAEEGVGYFPDNPWLLNMYGLGLMNTGKKDEAQEVFKRADDILATYTPDAWQSAYPGNNPAVAPQGLAELRESVSINLELSQKP